MLIMSYNLVTYINGTEVSLQKNIAGHNILIKEQSQKLEIKKKKNNENQKKDAS